MILQIKSANNYLLDLLFKNPETDRGLYFKPLRDGIIAGHAISAHEYEVVYEDTRNSYMPEDSNRLDFQSYCSPLAVMNICTELFAHILKDRETFNNTAIDWLGITQGAADTQACTIYIPTFYIHSSWYRDDTFLLSRYFEGVKVAHGKGRNFRLTIAAASVFEAFNLLNLVALFTHMTNEYGQFTYIDDSFAAKYVRILTNIDAVPYFIFYLYIKRTVKSQKQFEQVKPMMEQYLAGRGLQAQLTFYGTQQDRQHFITGQLELDTPVLDIGCGELGYYKRMMNLGLQARYYAVDEDEQFRQAAESLTHRYESDNLFFYQALDEFEPPAEAINIIMSEVIEQNTLEAARDLIGKALRYNFGKILITTPNADFNTFYFEGNQKRHEDHQFELSNEAFRELIRNCVAPYGDRVRMSFTGIGDRINGIQPTQACILTKQNRLVTAN